MLRGFHRGVKAARPKRAAVIEMKWRLARVINCSRSASPGVTRALIGGAGCSGWCVVSSARGCQSLVGAHAATHVPVD